MLYELIRFLINLQVKLTLNIKNYIILLLNMLNKYSFDFSSYLKINFLTSLVNLLIINKNDFRINNQIINNLTNYIKFFNISFIKIKLFYKKIILLTYNEFLNKKFNMLKISNFNLGYNSILNKKPQG